MAIPRGWVTVAPAARPGALHAVGLGRLKPAVLHSVLPGWGSSGSVTLADPASAGGSSGDQAIMSLTCAAAPHLPGKHQRADR
jgi:hypothetical protein